MTEHYFKAPESYKNTENFPDALFWMASKIGLIKHIVQFPSFRVIYIAMLFQQKKMLHSDPKGIIIEIATCSKGRLFLSLLADWLQLRKKGHHHQPASVNLGTGSKDAFKIHARASFALLLGIIFSITVGDAYPI